MRSDRAGLRILEPALHKLQQIYEDMPENQRSRFNFILAIVVQDTSNNNQLKILNDLRSRFDFPLEIRIFNLEQLRKSFETGDN
jgi:cellulose biosynthesis protein BcsQ